MQPNVILTGITFEELQDSIKCIVKHEVDRILTSTPTPEPEPEYLTRHQVANLYGISLPTLHEWTKTGKIKAKRIGSRVRYLKTDVYNALKDVETLKYKRG